MRRLLAVLLASSALLAAAPAVHAEVQTKLTPWLMEGAGVNVPQAFETANIDGVMVLHLVPAVEKFGDEAVAENVQLLEITLKEYGDIAPDRMTYALAHLAARQPDLKDNAALVVEQLGLSKEAFEQKLREKQAEASR